MTTEREVWLADHPSAPGHDLHLRPGAGPVPPGALPALRRPGRRGGGGCGVTGHIPRDRGNWPLPSFTSLSPAHVVWLGSVKSVTLTSPPTISTLGELTRVRPPAPHAARGDPRQPARRAPRGPRPVAGPARLRDHRDPAARAGAARRPRRRAARRARPGQDPAAAHPGRPARRVDAGDRRLRARRAPLRRRSPTPPSGGPPTEGDDAAGRVAAPRRAVRREAGHPGHVAWPT